MELKLKVAMIDMELREVCMNAIVDAMTEAEEQMGEASEQLGSKPGKLGVCAEELLDREQSTMFTAKARWRNGLSIWPEKEA